MENFSISSPSLSGVTIKDAIFTKLQQSKAILTCVMFATEFVRSDVTLDNHTHLQCAVGGR